MSRIKRKGSKSNSGAPSWGTNLKYVKCDTCDNQVRASATAVKIICPSCVNKLVDPPSVALPDPKPNMPKGWRNRKQYVHLDGSVYEYGVENIDLFGTIQPKPPKIVKPKPKQSLSKLPVAERSEARTRLLNELKFLRTELQRAANKTDQKKITNKITKVTKQLSTIKN